MVENKTTMEHKIILKCRICLEENDEDNMFELFMGAESNADGREINLKLSKKVEYCCGVQIRESSELPSKICWKCFEMTRMWYNFCQMCMNSQVYLESMCGDRIRPKGCDDTEFLQYLMEQLQIFREKVYEPTDTLEVDSDEDDVEFIDDGDDSVCIEPEPVTAADSDSDVERNVKEEKEQYDDQTDVKLKEKALNDTAVTTTANTVKNTKSPSQQRTSKTQQKRQSVDRRLYRPPSPTSYMCYICGNVYSKKASFAYHMTLHNNVKPHECELCGKSFRQICELKNHMRRHTGEKPYKCSYCDRHFIDRSEKHRHERVHTNTRPYICSVCGKSFMYSAILKNHSKLHTGKKDFNCMVCEKAFTLQHQLKAHLQTMTHKQKEAHFVSAGYEVVYE